nr:hypothetical protein [Tanacetum cinerariifolium]
MMNMVPHEAFACSCAEGDAVLRKSYKPESCGRVVPLLPVAPDRFFGELEASVEKLSDEGGGGEQADQGDSASGGYGVGVQPVNVITEAVVEDVAPAELQRKKKQKTKVVDVGKPLHQAKKLRGDYGVSGKPTVGGKSQSAVQRLLARAVQHAEVRGGVMPTLPFVSSSVSTTPEREGGDHAEFLAEANLRTLEAPKRFVISSDSSDHSGANIAEAKVDSIVRTFDNLPRNSSQEASARLKRPTKVAGVVAKKKAPTKADTCKGLKVLSEVALFEKIQLKEAIQRSKKDFHISQGGGSGIGTDDVTGTKPGVPDVPKHDYKSEEESWGDSREEEDDDAETKNESNEGGNDDNAHDDDGGGNDKDAHNDDDGNDDDDNDDDIDEEITESDNEETKENMDERVPTLEDVNVNLRQEDDEMTKADQGGADHNVSQESRFKYAEKDAHMEENKSYLNVEYKNELYDALVKSYETNKDLFDTYGQTFSLKRSHDKDKYQDPSVGSDQGLKRRKSGKDAESSKDPKSKESRHKMPLNQDSEFGHIDDQRDDKAIPKDDSFKKPDKHPTPDHEWNKIKSIDFRPA